jgi:hypothetical protein
VYPHLDRALVAELAPAFRAEHGAALGMHDELATDEALDLLAAQERDQLLVEAAREGDCPHGYSSLKTPTTRPRIWTCDA